MNRKFVALFLTVAMGAVGACSSFQHVVWPVVTKCSGTVTGSLVDHVSEILAGGDATAQLEALAIDNGADLIVCIVNQIVSNLKATRMVSREANQPDPEASVKVKNGEDFLKSHHVSVK